MKSPIEQIIFLKNNAPSLSEEVGWPGIYWINIAFDLFGDEPQNIDAAVVHRVRKIIFSYGLTGIYMCSVTNLKKYLEALRKGCEPADTYFLGPIIRAVEYTIESLENPKIKNEKVVWPYLRMMGLDGKVKFYEYLEAQELKIDSKASYFDLDVFMMNDGVPKLLKQMWFEHSSKLKTEISQLKSYFLFLTIYQTHIINYEVNKVKYLKKTAFNAKKSKLLVLREI